MSWEWEVDEDWADVAGAEGRMWVSTHGRVFRVHGRTRRTTEVPTSARVVNKYGERVHRVIRLREGRYMGLHVMVLEAFRGRRPTGWFGRHWNDDRGNNFLSNVVWGSGSDNQRDRVRNKGHGTGNVLSPEVWTR